ncbi:MAG: glycosyltransferase family 39 protein, partial [Halothece sp. Uz-M2-17]|nr:glycosyltransferase family 39 protein [Halothece sp. Uz-M2-17]
MLLTINQFYFWRNHNALFKNKAYLMLGAILVVSTILRLYQLGEESLWGDELASLRDVKKIGEGQFFVTRILYFLLLNVWMYFGESEFWLRLPSVAFGVLSVFLLYRLGSKLFDPTIGLIAALFLTLSPIAIFHSQEVRMYMLSVFIGLAGTLALVDYLLNRKRKFIIFWMILRVLAILTTPINILLLMPDLIILGWDGFGKVKLKQRPKQTVAVGISGVLIGSIFFFSFYPAIAPLLDFAERKQMANMELTLMSFIGGITRLSVWPLEAPVPSLSWFYEHLFNLYAIGLIALIITAFVANYSLIHKRWIILWGLLTLIVLYFSCKFIAPMLWGVPRYSLFLAPYLFILFALGLVQIWQWKKQVASVLISIYFFTIVGSIWYYYNTDTNEDWRSAFQVVNTYEKPNDALALFPPYSQLASDYYYQGNSPIYLIEDIDSYPDESDLNALVNQLN